MTALFDEADALFGRRTEVRSVRDRYANVEVAYLLQRLETQEGFVFLTTNLRQNVDQDFLRRGHIIVQIPPPDATERQEIWRTRLALLLRYRPPAPEARDWPLAASLHPTGCKDQWGGQPPPRAARPSLLRSLSDRVMRAGTRPPPKLRPQRRE